MSDNDLIRRGDVLELLQSGLGLTLDKLSRRIAAIPAAPAPTLAAALALPEIAALVDAGNVMAKALRGNYIVPQSAQNWEAALAAIKVTP